MDYRRIFNPDTDRIVFAAECFNYMVNYRDTDVCGLCWSFLLVGRESWTFSVLAVSALSGLAVGFCDGLLLVFYPSTHFTHGYLARTKNQGVRKGTYGESLSTFRFVADQPWCVVHHSFFYFDQSSACL